MKPVRVLIVDDSATMRSLIRELLRSEPAIEVAGEAGDALEARAAIKALNPDVITLDVEMPKMNGLEFLDKIMRLRPTPVIMVSSETARGASAAITALEIGAFDCIAKPGPGEAEVFAQALIGKVRAAAGSRARFAACRDGSASPRQTAPPVAADYCPDGCLVAIGASTGGVEAITAILSEFPENCPPTMITQHMPPVFTKSFAERLDRRCRPKVSEALDGAPLLPGLVYLAPGRDNPSGCFNRGSASMQADRGRSGQWSSPLGGCVAEIHGEGCRLERGWRHSHRDGRRWSRWASCDAPRRRPDPGSRRSVMPHPRNAQGGFRTRRRGDAGAVKQNCFGNPTYKLIWKEGGKRCHSRQRYAYSSSMINSPAVF
jgi:chemotaxis response regulator CheB